MSTKVIVTIIDGCIDAVMSTDGSVELLVIDRNDCYDTFDVGDVVARDKEVTEFCSGEVFTSILSPHHLYRGGEYLPDYETKEEEQ